MLAFGSILGQHRLRHTCPVEEEMEMQDDMKMGKKTESDDNFTADLPQTLSKQ